METSNTRYNDARDGSTTGNQTASPLISQLPPELLAKILQLALPSIKLTVAFEEADLLRHIRRLYTMRSVTKHWQEIIDGTPTFWKFVLGSLPPHVNDMTVLRSCNNPLYVVHAHPKWTIVNKYPSPAAFFEAFAHVLPRWSGYHGPFVSKYLQSAAPLLQNLDLTGRFREESVVEPLVLLGGFTASLRHVQLYQVSIRWKPGLFTQLKTLKLEQLGWDGLTTTHLLDFLHSSPGLQHLRLRFVHATVNNPPSSQVITLQSLRSIVIYNCGDDVIESILRQIRAPSCIEFYLLLDLRNELNLSRFLNETFPLFQHILRTIHKRYGLSEMRLNASGFEWRTVGQAIESCLLIRSNFPAICIRWVERILRSDTGLKISLGWGLDLNDDVLETLAPMRCVTAVVLEEARWERREILLILKLLGRRLDTSTHLPSLPCLREILLISGGWNAQDLLELLQSRFSSLSEETVESPLPPLKIRICRGVFYSDSRPRGIFNYAMLAKIRETKGLQCIQFVHPPWRDGMLAITWEEETSEHVWFMETGGLI